MSAGGVTWRPHAPAAKAARGGAASSPSTEGAASHGWRAPVGAASVALRPPHAAGVEAQEWCVFRARSGSGVGDVDAFMWPPPPTDGKSVPVRFRGQIVDIQSRTGSSSVIPASSLPRHRRNFVVSSSSFALPFVSSTHLRCWCPSSCSSCTRPRPPPLQPQCLHAWSVLPAPLPPPLSYPTQHQYYLSQSVSSSRLLRSALHSAFSSGTFPAACALVLVPPTCT